MGVVGTVAAIGAVLVASLVVVGCGGGSSSASLSKQQFVKQGNAICKRGEKERQEIVAKATAQLGSAGEVSQAQQEKVILELVPPYEASAQKLSELGAPKGDEKQVEAIVKAMEKAVEKVEADPGTALTGSLPFKEASELATKYGLSSCSV